MTTIFVDPLAVKNAKLVTSDLTGFEDKRRYYELGDALIVCRNGLDLHQLKGQKVDAIIGWDTAHPGFTLDESQIGQKRTKITIFRLIDPLLLAPSLTAIANLKKSNSG